MMSEKWWEEREKHWEEVGNEGKRINRNIWIGFVLLIIWLVYVFSDPIWIWN